MCYNKKVNWIIKPTDDSFLVVEEYSGGIYSDFEGYDEALFIVTMLNDSNTQPNPEGNHV